MYRTNRSRFSRLLLAASISAMLALGTAACGEGQDGDVFTEPGAGVPGTPEQDVTTPDSGPGDDEDEQATGSDHS